MMIIGAFVVVLCMLALTAGVCLLSLYFEKHSINKEYDERQELAQGKAYRLAFLVLQIYLLAVLIVEVAVGLEWISIQLVVLTGFMLGTFTYDTYCMLTDAGMPLREKTEKSALLNAVMAVAWFVMFFGYLNLYLGLDESLGLSLTGKDSNHWIRLYLGVMYAYKALSCLVQYLRNKKE